MTYVIKKQSVKFWMWKHSTRQISWALKKKKSLSWGILKDEETAQDYRDITRKSVQFGEKSICLILESWEKLNMD